MTPEEILFFVDAMEGGVARLLRGTEAFTVSAALLPAGAKEGSWLRASFKLAPAPADDGADVRSKLGQNDDGGDIKL